VLEQLKVQRSLDSVQTALDVPVTVRVERSSEREQRSQHDKARRARGHAGGVCGRFLL
tara:strand:+ start:2496 stop:2669 length:174 start_codon:yes stop_codon:yes gene_type:complete